MRNQQKVIFNAVSFLISGSLTVVLFLEDKFFERKTSVLKYLHNIEAHRYHAAVFTGIAHKDSEEFAFLHHPIAFLSDRLHLFKEVLEYQL